MRLSVFIAASLDGYIATRDGRLDWLDDAVGPGEDYGYETFIADVDALAMGRGTYDFIADLDPLPFGDRAVFVFTHRPPGPREGVAFWDVDPHEAVRRWREQGLEHVYVDGGQLIGSFLAEGLIDDMVLTTAPVLLGDGIPLFPSHGASSSWVLQDVQTWPSGMVNRTYTRRPADQ
jgi:dihydrofolate reductase